MAPRIILIFFLLIVCYKCFPVKAQSENETELELIQFELQIIESVKRNSLNVSELFYNKHPDTDYYPIKLEASLAQPLDIDLATVLAQAVENNINLNIARQDSVIAKWNFWKQFSKGLPNIVTSITEQSLDGTFYLNKALRNPVNENQSKGTFRINYRAFDGGTTAFLILAEKHYRQSTDEKEKLQYNKTLVDSVDFYSKLLKEQITLSSKLKAFKEAASSLDVSKKFYKAGTGTKYDVLLAESRLAIAQQDLISQQASFRVAEINLAQHLNYPLLTPLRAKESSLMELQLINESLSMEEFIDTAFKESPKVKSALETKKAAIREGLSKVGDFLPNIDLFADFSGTGPGFDNLAEITTLGIQASLDFGTGLGVNSLSSLLQSRSVIKKAKLLYTQELQNIEKDLRLAFINYQKSKSFMDAASREVLAAQEALRLSKLRYQNGLEILTNVLKQEADFSSAETKLINSTVDYNLAQATLAFHMGIISIDSLIQ